MEQKSLLKAVKTSENSTTTHTHIAYIRPDGSGITSENSGHKHDIVTLTGEQSSLGIVPLTLTGKPTVVESDGHTHNLEDIPIKEVKEKELTEEEELTTNMALYKEAKTINDSSRQKGKESEEYYMGKQWAESDRAVLASEDRACITINEIKPKIDMLSGHQRQNRTDIKLIPNQDGEQTTADIYESRILNICQQNNYEYEETRTFDDLLRAGMGAMQVSITASEDAIGEVKIENKYWEYVMFGPHEKLDGADASYAVVVTPITKAELKQLYPDKADKIEKDFEDLKGDTERPLSRADRYPRKGMDINIFDLDAFIRAEDLVNIKKRSYRLIEVQRKVHKRTPVIFNAKHNFYFNASGMSEKDFKDAMSIEELSKINHISDTIRIVTFAGKTLLANEKSLFSKINFVPFYANKIGKDWWSKIEEAKGPQQELNKRHSQTIDIINKNSSHGIGITAEAFETISEYNRYVKERNKPGFVAKFKPGFKEHIYEFRTIDYPSEVVAASNLMSQKIDTIMNVHGESMGGGGGANESGVSMAQRQREGLKGNEYLFDNFSLSKKRIAQLIIEAIQIVDSPEKLLRIAENQGNKTLANSNPVDLYPQVDQNTAVQIAAQMGAIPPEVMQALQSQDPNAQQQAQKMLQQIMPQVMPQIQKMMNEKKRVELLKMLENFELTKYDIVVTESPFSPSVRFASYLTIVEMFRGNPNAPIAQIIKLNPMLDQKTKDELLQGIQTQAQAQQQMEHEKYQTEKDKTTTAAQAGIAKELIKQHSQQVGIPQ